MIKKDKEIEITCAFCKRTYKFFVRNEDYEEYVNNHEPNRDPRELFPYLMEEEIDLMESNICENCAI